MTNLQERAAAAIRDVKIINGEEDAGWRRRDLAFQRLVRDGVIDVKHPAKFSKVILDKIREVLDEITADWDFEPLVFDPFAGVGGIHHLRRENEHGQRYHTIGLEIEWEWCALGRQHGPMIQMDFFQFEWDRTYWGAPDFIITSPTYGNRFADKHRAMDGSRRRSYTHDLGHQLSLGNSGGMQWGKKYRSFHRRAWQRCYGMLDPGGYMILNVSDHVRDRKVVPVADFHCETMLDIGFEHMMGYKVVTPRHRDGENSELRVDGEWVHVFKKPQS